MIKNCVGIFILSILLFLQACQNSSLVGSDLLDQDGIVVKFTDTTSLNFATVSASDSLVTRSSERNLAKLFVGQMTDEYFGSTEAIPYFRPTIGGKLPDFYMDDLEQFVTIDSVIMYVALDTTLLYGKYLEPHQITPIQLESEIDANQTYYKFDKLNVSNPLGPQSTVIGSKNNYQIVYAEDTFNLNPALRIPLDKSIIDNVIMDTTMFKSDTSFAKYIKGIALYDETNNSVLGLDFEIAQSLSSPLNKMVVFYTDSVQKVQMFPIIGARSQYVKRDHSGSVAESVKDVLNDEQGLAYIQSYNEYDVKVEIPNATQQNWGDVLIKKATLEFTVAALDGDDLYDAVPFVICEKLNEDGERVVIDDLERIITQKLNVSQIFGGSLTEVTENGVDLMKYSLNITEYFKNLIQKDSDTPSTIYLTPGAPLRSVGRTIIYGPNHEEFPMKLNVLYSLPK